MSAPLTPEGKDNIVNPLDAPQYRMYDIAIAFLNNTITLAEYDKTAVEFLDAYANTKTAAKDERIRFLEQWADTTEHLINSYKESEKEKDERIKELEERLNHSIGCRRNENQLYNEVHATLTKELEAVKRDKKDLQKRVVMEVRDMVRVMGERDDVIQLLKGYDNVPFEGIARHNWNIKRLETLSNLSSGETKAEKEPSFCVVYRDINTAKEFKTDPYTAKELLLTMEDDVFESAIKCDCQPVGETNFVECNCQAPYDSYVFNRVELANPSNNSSSEKYARIAELEKVAAMWSKAANERALERDQLLEKVEQLEKDIVKYTRQEKELHNIIEEQRSTLVTRYALLKDTQAERDQAFDLLEEVREEASESISYDTNMKIKALLYSRENKKP